MIEIIKKSFIINIYTKGLRKILIHKILLPTRSNWFGKIQLHKRADSSYRMEINHHSQVFPPTRNNDSMYLDWELKGINRFSRS